MPRKKHRNKKQERSDRNFYKRRAGLERELVELDQPDITRKMPAMARALALAQIERKIYDLQTTCRHRSEANCHPIRRSHCGHCGVRLVEFAFAAA